MADATGPVQEYRVVMRWTQAQGGHAEPAAAGRTGDLAWAERTLASTLELTAKPGARIETAWIEQRQVSPWQPLAPEA